MWHVPWVLKQQLCQLVSYVDIHDLNLVIKDVWHLGRWNIDNLFTPIPQDIIDLNLTLYPCIVESNPDAWVWQPRVDGAYSVKSGYSWLIKSHLEADAESKWGWI